MLVVREYLVALNPVEMVRNDHLCLFLSAVGLAQCLRLESDTATRTLWRPAAKDCGPIGQDSGGGWLT